MRKDDLTFVCESSYWQLYKSMNRLFKNSHCFLATSSKFSTECTSYLSVENNWITLNFQSKYLNRFISCLHGNHKWSSSWCVDMCVSMVIWLFSHQWTLDTDREIGNAWQHRTTCSRRSWVKKIDHTLMFSAGYMSALLGSVPDPWDQSLITFSSDLYKQMLILYMYVS